MGDGFVAGDDCDPDAPWRPDFDGWSAADTARVADVEPVELSTEEVEPPHPRRIGATSHSTGGGKPGASARRGARLVAAVVVTAVVVGVAIVASSAWFGGPGRTVGVEAGPRIPDRDLVVWSSGFDTAIEGVAAGSGSLVVAAAGGLTALDLEDGSVVWSSPSALGGAGAQVDRLAVSGDRVVAQIRSGSGRADVRSFDRLTGTEVWRSADLDGSHTIAGNLDSPLVVRRRRLDGASVLEFVDPADGAVLGDPLPLSGVSAAGANLAIEPSDRRVAIWSIDEMDVVAGPVDSFSLRTVAPLDGDVVGIDLDGRIVAYDGDGRRIDEFLLSNNSSDDELIVRAELVAVLSSGGVGVVAGDTSVGFRIDNGRIAVVWSRAGRVAVPVATDRGPAAVFVGTDGSGRRVEEIVDASDGSTIVATAPGRERSPVVGGNGFVLAPEAGASERVVEAFDFDAQPLWSMPIPAAADFELIGGALVVVDVRPDGSTLTVAR